MSSLDTARAELAFLALYLSKAETRDKICRAIQYGSKFISSGEPGAAQNVDKTTSLARKVFRLFKYVNELHALLLPPPKDTPLPLILLGKSKNALLGTFLMLDQIVWAGRTGIYKNKERTDLISRISLFCFLGSNIVTSVIESSELGRLALSIKKLEKELKQKKLLSKADRSDLEQQRTQKLKQSNARMLILAKASLDTIVAIGLLQLAPKKVTPKVTGGLGFITSLISCYQLLPPPSKAKPA
eukprot:TRINITY_DN820_c0_g1_i1.p1 TRINITY_DN820_c0_g1~~TRINITY_DN820_c0_g1_i1.p1  ORF type:complete len:243 (-),score=57.82 TRINITY_DN820_c0_g1_i1:310-1038(-)